MTTTISEEELQKAVAEHLGWTHFGYTLYEGTRALCAAVPPKRWSNVSNYEYPKASHIGANHERIERYIVPLYSTSLDAIHKAEESLDGYMMLKYATELMFACGGPGTGGSFGHVHAHAKTRAKAFLLTVGKKITPKKKKNTRNY